MPKKQRRDSAYYEERLKNEAPTVYADLQAGKHRTVTVAAIAAGLRKPRTRLHELTNAFSKASRSERASFLGWLAAQGHLTAASPAPTTVSSPIAVDRRLVPSVKNRIDEIIAKRHMKVGDVMAEMGLTKLDPSLGLALSRGNRLKPEVIGALEKWLALNSSV